MVKEFGIGTHASYMLGNPGETLETINRTLEFARELNTDYAQFSLATPFPGTEMWDMAERDGLIETRDFSRFTWYYSPVFATGDLTPDILTEIQQNAYDSYRGGKQG